MPSKSNDFKNDSEDLSFSLSRVNEHNNNSQPKSVNNNEYEQKLTKREKQDKAYEIKKLITSANQLFVKNDFNLCIRELKRLLVIAPKNANAYFLLGLVFEEMKEDIKAYNFFLIASQLFKTNYALWEKLYFLSDKMNLLSDKLYFIQMLQRKKNTKELVLEKLELYKILKFKYKVLETKIELFYFDGVDFNIFNIIRNETKHKLRTAQCAVCLIKYFKQYPEKCGLEFLQDIIRLQFDTGYLYGTRNLIEKYLIGKTVLGRDIRLIYIICVLLNNTTSEEIKSHNNIKDIEDFNFRESLFEAKESVFNYLNYNEEPFDIYKNNELINQNEVSKTLNLDYFLSDTNPYDKWSDINALICDDCFWVNFREFDHIKGLLSALNSLKMEDEYLRILSKLENFVEDLKEFVYLSYANFYYEKNNLNNALVFYQKTLEINQDNNAVKSKLYEIYKTLGNIDLANKFCTISSLINFVDDIYNEDKTKCMISIEKCNEIRLTYLKSRSLFKSDTEEYLKLVSPLIDDFLENRFLFPKFKMHILVEDTKEKKNNESSDFCLKPEESNIRCLSLHGLNTDEWSAVLLEYIISNITKGNLKLVSFLLKKSLDCLIFKKRYDVYLQFVFMTIKHSIFYNDLQLLSSCFKKTLFLSKEFSWANFYYYLLNFFPGYIYKRSFSNVQRNIRRVYKRNNVFIANKEKTSLSVYKSLELNIFLSSFFTKNIAKKSYKLINSIILDENIKNRMMYFLILIITCKSRRNETKNETVKKGLEGLKNLLPLCNKEEYCNVSYNIGVTYHTLGYLGFAEKFYLLALKSENPELARMARLNLIIIYSKNNNKLLKKIYEEDKI